MSENNKWLYQFTITKEIETEETQEQEVNGEKVKVTKKVKKPQDFSFALKKPSRKLVEQADLFYGVKLSEGIRAGLLTKALLLKRYRDDGGAFSELDIKVFDALVEQARKLELEHQRYMTNIDQMPDEEKNAKLKEIESKKTEIYQALQNFETLNQTLFAHTAETKAQNFLSNWWVLHLSYWDKEGKGNYEEFFPGKDFDEKMSMWDFHADSEDSFKLEALARFGLVVGLWNAGARSKEEFEDGIKRYGTQATQEMTEAVKADEKSVNA